MREMNIIISLGLTLLSTTLARNSNETEICLREPDVTEQAKNVTQCYNDMFYAKTVKNSTHLTCNNFISYNEKFRNFYKYASKKCFNVTDATLVKEQTMYLNMVKFLMDNNSTMEYYKEGKIGCLNNLGDEIKTCNTHNLTVLNETDIAQTMLRRVAFKFESTGTRTMRNICNGLIESWNCTLEIINNKCTPEIADYTNSMFGAVSDVCETTTGSANNFVISQLIFIITAFIVMYQ